MPFCWCPAGTHLCWCLNGATKRPSGSLQISTTRMAGLALVWPSTCHPICTHGMLLWHCWGFRGPTNPPAVAEEEEPRPPHPKALLARSQSLEYREEQDLKLSLSEDLYSSSVDKVVASSVYNFKAFQEFGADCSHLAFSTALWQSSLMKGERS